VVYGSGGFAAHEDVSVPPAMPEWSPVRVYGGYGAWAQLRREQSAAPRVACGCEHACGVHGHDHAAAWASRVPASDLKSFWGALGCACWAV
ncbi:MAG: amidohydrolase, partial [Dyella sp.]|nr:amidohydrolase [Dyella sp.]